MSEKKILSNPILPGCYPDPSICRVDDDFYLVCSTFSYFPGVPIFHSTDLANWQQIGHVLDRPSQLPLSCQALSGGIFAPAIRYHAGTFYMITTNIDHGGNFIVTATDPRGPWSEPHWLKEAPGIDPSLFWDDDGKAYYVGQRGWETGIPEIWGSEIDLQEFKLVGKSESLWRGALHNCVSPESPHLYKKDGWYYLMIAEGGTEIFHSVTIARSQNPLGPFEGYRGNPILTHRHLGKGQPISNIGHGDLVELKDGSWYMVMLGSRPYGGYHKNMGRETFIAPVIWEDGWPVVSPGSGKIEWTYPAPDLPEMSIKKTPAKDDFDDDQLDMIWNGLGTPDQGLYHLSDGKLRIRAVEKAICPEDGTVSPVIFHDSSISSLGFIGRRQQNMSYEVKTHMKLHHLSGKESAGLILLQNGFNSLRVEMIVQAGQRQIRVVKGFTQQHSSEWEIIYHDQVLGQIEWDSDEVILVLKADLQNNSIYAVNAQGTEFLVAENVNGGFLGFETCGGFIGTYIGMFASGNGSDTGNYAEFDWFEYNGK